MAASSSLFANVSNEEIAELTLMQFLSQCSMQPSKSASELVSLFGYYTNSNSIDSWSRNSQ